MPKIIEGIYEDGVIKPLEPVEISKRSKILIAIFDEPSKSVESYFRRLSPQELLRYYEERAEKLKGAGATDEIAMGQIKEVIDKVREDALKKGVAIDDYWVEE
jgi:predicted DNA-binding antitoxin AbrB/MazE fold protein